MKKIVLMITCLLMLSGCFKKDTMDDITIYTTTYPIEYITNRLYGNYSNISSIYPKGVNIQINPCIECTDNLYTLTEKQLVDYSKGDLFIFNSLLYEGKYVEGLFKNNKKLKIVNATDHMTNQDYNELEELWLDPARLLTLARNVKNGLNEYISNYYIKQELDTNFENLKSDLDKLSSRLSTVTKASKKKIIVTGNSVFKFLSNDKYGLTVYSLEENEDLNPKTISTVKGLIADGTVKYIYVKQYEEINETIKKLIAGTDVQIIEIHTLTNLTETDETNKKDYFSIMTENIELFKKGLS